MKSYIHTNYLILGLFIIFLLSANSVTGQFLTVPRESPHASVSQTIGLSTITIDYHRPAVKNRDIWGALVPYGLTNLGFGGGNPAPWRAGANENTTITFSDDAVVEGHTVSAGIYGLHMIANENEWTIILNNQSTAWGSFFYDDSKDYLRFNVVPVEAPFREWLLYGFENLTRNSAEAFLQWEKKNISFKIEFDVDKIVIDNFKKELIGINGFRWNAFNQAALYTLNNNVYLEQGLQWAEQAINLNNSFATLSTKAEILKHMGRNEEGNKILEPAIENASEVELNQYGYGLMAKGDMENAIQIFKVNAEKHEDSWNVYDSLGDAYSRIDEVDKAIEYYEKAYSLAPESQKQRIERILKNLK